MNRKQVEQSILMALQTLGVTSAWSKSPTTDRDTKWWANDILAHDLAETICKQYNEQPAPDVQEECNRVQQNQACCACHAIDALKYLIDIAEKTSGSALWLALFQHMLTNYENHNAHKGVKNG